MHLLHHFQMEIDYTASKLYSNYKGILDPYPNPLIYRFNKAIIVEAIIEVATLSTGLHRSDYSRDEAPPPVDMSRFNSVYVRPHHPRPQN